MIGKTFGKLTIIGVGESYKHTSPTTGKMTSKRRWICQCSCGERLTVINRLLTAGVSTQCKSCAYASRPQSTRRLSKEERLFNIHIKRRARLGGINVYITIEQFMSITKKDCNYCGSEPKVKNVYKNKFAKSEYVRFNGVDRIDSDGPYSLENCVPCCWRCNSMKSDTSVKDFINHIKKILEFQEKGVVNEQ